MYYKFFTSLIFIIAILISGCVVEGPQEAAIVSTESEYSSVPNPENAPQESSAENASTENASTEAIVEASAADILPVVQFTDEYTESSEDANQDGLLDNLNIDVGVSAPQAGYYTIGATLETGQPARVPQAIDGIQVRQFLEVGPQMVRLTFAGKYIRLSKFDGSYMLSQIWITDIENPTPIELRTNLLDSRIKSYETSIYEHAQFQEQ